MTDELNSRVREWLNGSDTGSSSIALAREAAGMGGDAAHPHDGSDLGRCLRLIARIPEVRGAVDTLAAKDAYWKALAPEWDTLKALYIEEMQKPTGKTYKAMRALLDPVEKADKRVIRIGPGITMRFGR